MTPNTEGNLANLRSKAREQARKGMKVFPCLAGQKRPASTHGHKDATADPAQIESWWSKEPYNIAFCPNDMGWCVIDIDGPEGEAAWTALQVEHGRAPETYEVRTASGVGRHLYFKGSLPPTVGKLAAQIDTRGIGSYVLLPPSVVNGGEYVTTKNVPLAPLPKWIAERLAKPAELSATLPAVNAGKPFSPSQLTEMLRHCDPDCSRNDWRDIGASLHAAACTDPDFDKRDLYIRWSRGELRKSGIEASLPASYVSDQDCALVYDTMPPRLGGVGPGTLVHFARQAGYFGESDRTATQEIFKHALARLGNQCELSPKIVPIPISDVLLRTVAPVQEVVVGLVEKGTVTFLSAPGGSHKSRFAIQLGLCIATGTPVFGRPVERATFVYVSYEDHIDEVTRRVQKITTRLNLPTDPTGQYWDLSGKDAPLAVIHETGDYGLESFHERLSTQLRAIPGHKFVVFDSTYNALRFEGQAKINETSVMASIGLLQRLCDEVDCTILTLWHPSQAGQERGDASGWSVAWHNAPRARLSLTPVKNSEDAFELKTEKRNHGPKGKPLTLYWSDGVLLPRTEVASSEQSARFLEACVTVATLAAEQGAPIQRQRRLNTWMVDWIENAVGYRPSEREAKEGLARVMSQGQLRYLQGTKYRTAGYYPADPARAAELARDAKHRPKPDE